jgi:NAD(P)-dependent dehydrogenase (short-subunit alcohol dehydrogenase family)
MKFKNKHAVVTGGANGIGRCVAETFLREGAAVAIIDTDKQAGEKLQSRFENLHFFHGDIAEKTILENFVNSLKTPVNCLSQQRLHRLRRTSFRLFLRGI